MRRLTIAAAALACALLVAPTAKADTLRFRYVAAADQGGSDLEEVVTDIDTPKGHPVVNGRFTFTTTTGAFTLEVDDDHVADGLTVAVLIAQVSGGPSRGIVDCFPVGSTRTYSGFAPGKLSVLIPGKTFWLPGWDGGDPGCDRKAITGSAYIGR